MKVSVIMPVYNDARKVGKSIKSVINQTFGDWELICVDDGSTDDTAVRLHRWSRTDSRIRVIVSETNCGPLAARIKGIQDAKGEYIAFIDASNRWTRDGLQSLVAAAEATGADITVGATRLCTPGLPLSRIYSLPRTSFLEKYPGHNATTDDIPTVYQSLLSGEIMTSMWDKIYSAGFVKEHLPPAIGAKVGEDLFFCASIFPYARRICFTDALLCLWAYSGLGRKYFMDLYAENLQAVAATMEAVATHAGALPADKDELLQCLSYNFMKMVEIGAAEHIAARRSMTCYFSDVMRSEAMSIATNHLKKFRGTALNTLDPEGLEKLGRRHLHNHRKYYIFTRILNTIYRI